MAGPPAGGTKVTVTGENLGIGVTDTYISVGGQECIINHVDPFIRFCHVSIMYYVDYNSTLLFIVLTSTQTCICFNSHVTQQCVTVLLILSCSNV